MSDINISNGTCYTAAGERLDDSFIPCGNTAFGYQTCCGAGDNCLAGLACFGIHGSGYGSFLTYLAGCTDPDYQDATCPQKEVDQPWVALTLCDNSNGAWAICSQPGNPSTLQPGATCSCTNSASATVAFQDATVLANIASLPSGKGETISWFPGHSPTGAPSPVAGANTSGGQGSAQSGGAAGTSATTNTATATSTGSVAPDLQSSPGASLPTASSSAGAGSASSSIDQSGSDDGLYGSSIGTGAIVGIVVGAVAVLLILAGLAFLFRRRRRRPQIADEKKLRDSGLSTSPMKPGGLGEYTRPRTPSMPEADGVPVVETDGQPAAPWMLRSELDGKEALSSRGSHSVAESAKSVHNGLVRYELP